MTTAPLSIIQICISVLSAIGVLGTLSFTIYFQIKNKKDNKYLDIARLLDYAFEKYKIFEYKYFEKINIEQKNWKL
ncbi:hypothetical protein [Spiroplasma endosymbiont of Danaus chrysippus]|uniref:hypothetical protein n=1 Tax=Spiroplasma endosymbiont of Danaus chrysippus TaxID=2691041 RepID=UPI00157BB4AC|nr:hypothetical protein [Spiroplasma endosymbiont of Danaus chrysippus]